VTDLYDRLRPADEPFDVATADRVWNRIASQRSEDATEDDDARRRDRPLRFEDSRVHDNRPRTRRFAAAAAIAAVVVGFAATATVVGNRDSAIAPSNTSPLPPPAVVVESPDVSNGPGGLVAGTSFTVADLPAGWEVDSMRASASGPIFGGGQWALLGADATVTGVVSVRAPYPLSDDEQAQYTSDDLDTTVRGVPSSQYQQDAEGGDTPAHTGITWIENSLLISVTATGDAQALTRPVAEALLIDESARTVSIPDELGLVPSSQLGFADPAAVTTTIEMSPTSNASSVSLTTRPNTFGYDLDRLVASTFDWQPTQIDNRDGMVATTPDGGRLMAWIIDDMFIFATATAGVPDTELLDIIDGIRFTDADDFRRIGNDVAARKNSEIASWEVFDRTTTLNGIGVTVRSRPGSSGANAICVDTPQPSCTELLSEGGAIDGFENYGTASYTLDTTTIGVAWVADSFEFGRSSSPRRPADFTAISLRPSDVVNAADGYLDGTTATIITDNRTQQGRFVIVDVPAGERHPTIRLAANGADPTNASIDDTFELTPTTTGLYNF